MLAFVSSIRVHRRRSHAVLVTTTTSLSDRDEVSTQSRSRVRTETIARPRRVQQLQGKESGPVRCVVCAGTMHKVASSHRRSGASAQGYRPTAQSLSIRVTTRTLAVRLSRQCAGRCRIITFSAGQVAAARGEVLSRSPWLIIPRRPQCKPPTRVNARQWNVFIKLPKLICASSEYVVRPRRWDKRMHHIMRQMSLLC